MGRKLATASLAVILGVYFCQLGTAAAAKEKSKEKPHVLLRGMVFTEEGLSLPGVRVTIKRKDDRKPKWRAVSDRRGEFAVRLPVEPATYEVATQSKHHHNQIRTIEVKDRTLVNVVFRLALKEDKSRKD